MTKKKPDFLRDLDTAIMDELTGGGIKGNAAGLVGTLTQIKEIKQLCGLPFCGYMAKLETVRPSGVPDEVTVVFAEDVPYRACSGIEFDVMQEFVEGSRLLLTGKAQTLKDFQSGRLLVYILADFVAVSEKAVEQDEAAVRGVIANKPTYRETPRGKRITDITVKVRNELTGGGIKGNAAGLVGTLTQIKEIKQLCGLPFCGYMAKLETVRPSGVPDEVTVVFAEDVPYRACSGIEFDVMQEFVEGSRLLLTGKAQTLKDFQSGRLLVYILADFVAVSEKAVEQDEAAVRGVIANKPTYRETPRGKRITDITVKVRNELTGGSCFLPCICWQEQADEAAQWQQGDTVELLGRYQSRQYEKVLDATTGEREQRTAYEVSVRLIRRKEEARNESKSRNE